MAQPYDVTTKDLIRQHPEDWIDFLGLPATKVRLVDTNLSTVVTDADKILVVDVDPSHASNHSYPSYVAHIELQSKYKTDDNERFLSYNILVGRNIRLPVRTIAVLLRPEADGDGMRAPLQRGFPGEPPYLEFRFQVVRVWEQSVELFLQAGIGLLPLATLSNVKEEQLPDVIRKIQERIDREAPEQAPTLWTSTYILMGLRYPAAFAEQLLKGVRAMEESSTYQAILEKGIEQGIEKGIEKGIEQGIEKGIEQGIVQGIVKGIEQGKTEGQEVGMILGERAILLRLGTRRYGEPASEELHKIEQIDTVDQLQRLADRLFEAESWAELLAIEALS